MIFSKSFSIIFSLQLRSISPSIRPLLPKGGQLLESGFLTHLHLDCSKASPISQESLPELKRVAALRAERRLPFNVHLSKADKLKPDELKAIGDALGRSIVSLDLSHSTVADGELAAMLKNCWNLEKLCLDFCKKLGGSGFLNIMKDSCPKLKKLSFNQSSRLDETELIALLRKRVLLASMSVGITLSPTGLSLASRWMQVSEIFDLTNLRQITDGALRELTVKCSTL